MNPHMKVLLATVILTAFAFGVWQNRELSLLKDREMVLRSELADRPPPHAGLEKPSPTPSGRPDGRTSLDAEAFVKRFEELVASGKRPSDQERNLLGDTLTKATPRELKMLVEALRNSSLPQELRAGVFITIAPRLAEGHPKLAAEIAIEGGEGNSFRAVMRVWLAADPQGAANWMEEAAAADPPLDPSRFRSVEELNLEALSLAVRVVAGPSAVGIEELLGKKDKLRLAALGEIMMTTSPEQFATVMTRISQSAGIPERERLELIGITMARHQDPALARQILQDASLSDEQVITTAVILIDHIDSSNIRSSVDWLIAATADSPARTEALARIGSGWKARSPEAATAYFREKNLTIPGSE